MKILVTGGTGTVGRPLVETLRNRGHSVHVADLAHQPGDDYDRADVAEYRQMERVVSKVKPDLVYHLGGEFGRVNGEDYYETMWATNAVGTKNMIRLQERERFRLVHFSSSEVYGDHHGLLTEDVMDKVAIRQLNDYAISKWVNEMQIMNSADRFGTETVRVRLFNTYGPGEYYNRYRSVVCFFTYRALKRLPYTVYTEHTRTLTYIDDCIDALAAISENFRPGEAYNIAGDDYVDMKTVSDLILKHTGGDASLVKEVPVEPNNTLHKRASNEKAKAHLGMKTRTPLNEGIAETTRWFRETYDL